MEFLLAFDAGRGASGVVIVNGLLLKHVVNISGRQVLRLGHSHDPAALHELLYDVDQLVCRCDLIVAFLSTLMVGRGAIRAIHRRLCVVQRLTAVDDAI
jgi:hypothetical protein